jgi:hypothetical protein
MAAADAQNQPPRPYSDAGETIAQSPEVCEAQQLMDTYFDAREAAAAEPTPDPDKVREIQAEVEEALRLSEKLAPERRSYGRYDPAAVQRFRDLIGYLRMHHGHEIPESVFAASEAFLEMAVKMYEAAPAADEDPLVGGDGSFAFLVPPRTDSEHPEYSVETVEPCPILQYVPDELRIHMYVGLPPFVVDRYNVDEYGQRGYMVLVPAFADMFPQLGRKEALARSAEMANEAVRLVHKVLGIDIVGLGASLPGLLHYGDAIRDPDVVTTTGHGGTIALIIDTMHTLGERGELDSKALQDIGIIGLGSIGDAIARIVATLYPDATIRICDTDAGKRGKTHSALSAIRRGGRRRGMLRGRGRDDRVIETADAREVLTHSRLVISAATHPIDLTGIESLRVTLLDDSQPGIASMSQIEDLGGRYLWVVGESLDGTFERATGWDFGGTLMRRGKFGCECECEEVSAERQRVFRELVQRGFDPEAARRMSLEAARIWAIRRPVEVEDVMRFSDLFRQHGIGAARTPQAEGRASLPDARMAHIASHGVWRWAGPLIRRAMTVVF